ncbi:MAG: phosphoenolpyruvate--protein phosphotransferase [Oceanococcaceae bacterium]
MSTTLTGIGVSRGIAIGPVHKLRGRAAPVERRSLRPGDISHEIARYTAARSTAKTQLEAIRDDIPVDTPREIAAFIDTHLLMLDDRAFASAVTDMISGEQVNAEWALQQQCQQLVAVFEAMDDAYLRSRQDDVEHVVARIQRLLMAGEHAALPKSDTGRPVVVADDITPADVILLHRQGIGGFITEYGGPLSHTAILARSLGLPALVGAHGASARVSEGELILLDGQTGEAIAQPSAAARAEFEQRAREHTRFRQILDALRDVPAVTRDGMPITLQCNIELPSDTAHAHGVGASGVGLYRTEFLYMNRESLPTEAEQYDAYVSVIQAISGPVTIRTLDVGADKQVDSGRIAGPTPNNPALGLRAIRLCLKEEDLFRVQLRALLRASAHGEIKIMLPMISNLDELLRARALIRGVMTELQEAGIAFDEHVPVGAMIEVPAAALSAPMLARHCDFFSIGTNDLIQYTLAIDRVDDEVNYLYDPLHPAVLKLIAMTIAAGDAQGIPVSMCGEMAGDARYTPLLLALGLREFSMHPSSVLEIKRMVRESSIAALAPLGRELQAVSDPGRLDDILQQLQPESGSR